MIHTNKAFRRFVGVKKNEVTGRLVDTTRLAYVYPGIVADVKATVKRGRRTPRTAAAMQMLGIYAFIIVFALVGVLLTGGALPLVPAFLLLSVRRLRPWAAGFVIGYAAYLIAVAVDGSVNVRFMPGHGLLDRAWLMLNGLVVLVVGRFTLPHR